VPDWSVGEDRRLAEWLGYGEYDDREDDMPIIAKDNRKEFTPAPEGLHQGVCVDVIDLGLVTGQYGEKHKVEIRWQLDLLEDASTSNPPRRFMVTNRYTLSLNEKATLRKHLEAWRGKLFTEEELAGFDLEKLLGVNGQLQIIHNLSEKGRTFANIQAIVPLGKGMTKIRPSEDYVRMKDRTSTEPGHTDPEPSEEEVPF
jgi:hypothetical protein